MIEDWTTYYINDITTTYQNQRTAQILNACTYSIFLTDDEDLIEDITAEQQAYLENKTNYDLSIDIAETKDGYSFEPIINGEIIDKDSLKAFVTKDINNQLTEINHHLRHVKKTILDNLKDIPIK